MLGKQCSLKRGLLKISSFGPRRKASDREQQGGNVNQQRVLRQCSHGTSSGVRKNAAHWSQEILIEARSVFAAPYTGANITPGVTGSASVLFLFFFFLSFFLFFLFFFFSHLHGSRDTSRHKTTSLDVARCSARACRPPRPRPFHLRLESDSFCDQNEMQCLCVA